MKTQILEQENLKEIVAHFFHQEIKLFSEKAEEKKVVLYKCTRSETQTPFRLLNELAVLTRKEEKLLKEAKVSKKVSTNLLEKIKNLYAEIKAVFVKHYEDWEKLEKTITPKFCYEQLMLYFGMIFKKFEII